MAKLNSLKDKPGAVKHRGAIRSRRVSTEKAVRDISKATECVVGSLNANPGRSGTLLDRGKIANKTDRVHRRLAGEANPIGPTPRSPSRATFVAVIQATELRNRHDGVSVSNSWSGGDGELHEVPAMGDPAHMIQVGRDRRVSTGDVQRRMAL